MIDAEAKAAYWAALAASDRRTAVDVALAQLDAGVGLDAVLTGLVCSAQLEVGRLWQTNEWNVAREHAATSISEEVVAALATRVSPAARRGRVVVTCVEGEWHSLPARVLSETLRIGGWQVDYLGASVPVAHLVQFVHDTGPDAVAFSCSISTSLPRARQMIEATREAGVPVLVGGRGFGEGGQWAHTLGATGWAPTAPGAIEVLQGPEWPSYVDPAPPLEHPLEEYERLHGTSAAVADAAMQRLLEQFPAMASYDRAQLSRTREDLGYIVDFLAAALFVDDASLFVDFVMWLGDVLVARRVPLVALTAGLDVVDAELAGLGLPKARERLGQGLAAVRQNQAHVVAS